MWYDLTYSCGHEGRVNLIGSHKSRESRLEWYGRGLCPECHEIDKAAKRAEHAEENAASAKAAAEMELPRLKGTKNQVTWATTIRQNFLEAIEKLQETCDDENREYVQLATMSVVLKEIYADWWIDESPREPWTPRSAYLLIYRQFSDVSANPEAARERIAKHERQAVPHTPDATRITVSPADKKTGPLPVKVCAHKTGIFVCPPNYNENLTDIVKDAGYKWRSDNRAWFLKSSSLGFVSADERAAEIGNTLLNAGFIVSFDTQNIADKAITADFEPVCKRWIRMFASGMYKACFAINWDGRNDDMYYEAKRLPGAKWDKDTHTMAVPGAAYREVLDFAEINGFKVSTGAQELADKARADEDSALRVVPAVPKKPKKQDKLKEILETKDAGVPDDLKDEIV